MAAPLRYDLVDAAVLEVYGIVREQGWLADRALERVLRRERRLYATERRAVAEAVYGMLRSQGQLEWLAGPAGRRRDGRPLRAVAGRGAATAPADAAARRLGVAAALLARALDRADARIAAIADPVLAPRGGGVPAALDRGALRGRAGQSRGSAPCREPSGERAPLTVRTNILAHLARRRSAGGVAGRAVQARRPASRRGGSSSTATPTPSG